MLLLDHHLELTPFYRYLKYQLGKDYLHLHLFQTKNFLQHLHSLTSILLQGLQHIQTLNLVSLPSHLTYILIKNNLSLQHWKFQYNHLAHLNHVPQRCKHYQVDKHLLHKYKNHHQLLHLNHNLMLENRNSHLCIHMNHHLS